MPNIELHGYQPGDALLMVQRIRKAFNDWPEPDEIVTTTFTSEVRGLNGVSTPFLRIISSDEELPDVKGRLQPLGEDIEVLPLREWVPKQNKR